MIRIARLTDYAVVILSHIGQCHTQFCQASGISQATHIAQPTVAKLLKKLTKSGFLSSHRGAQGGYELSRSPKDINVKDIIAAIEGPIAITKCNLNANACAVASTCHIKTPWTLINQKLVDTLTGISLADLMT